MKKYDSYKDSGIEWIGEIPSHWEIATVGRLCILGRGRVISAIEIAENEGVYPVYSSQTENYGIMGKINTYDFEGEYVTWTTDGANAGTVFYREGKFNCTNVCGTIQPKNWKQIDLKFLPYYLNLGTKFSVRLDINPKLMNNMMAKIPIVIPPKSEQTSIANFLDLKTSEIDEIIADKKRLLELYEEEKTAIINQAVTKGIDPDAPMKDSGIEWLGEIPEHWEVKKINWSFENIGSGTTPKADNQLYYFNGNINWLLTGDLNDGEIYDTSKKITQKAIDDYGTLRVYPAESIVIAMYGATIGRLGMLKIETTVNQACCVLSKPIYFDNKFAFYVLLAARPEIINMSYGGGQPNISQELIKSFRVPVPPISEQQSIVQHIETECSKIDFKKARTEELIELLTEYRTALISEAVTGKIKVTED